MRTVLLFIAGGLFMTGSVAHAAVLAMDNATVNPSWPRAGTSGKNFFNVEGDNNSTNASYGVIGFSGAAFNSSGATHVSGLTLTLTESNAAFSLPGSLTVYLASDSSADIQPTTSTAPVYAAGLMPEGIGATTAFGTLTSLGSIAFNTTGNTNTGMADSLSLPSLTAGVDAFLTNLLNNGGKIRVVLAPETVTTAATFAGFSNTTATTPGPTLDLVTDAPEPATAGILAIGGVVTLLHRRVRR